MPDIASLSKNKIIFFAVTGVVLLALIVGISLLGSSSSDTPKTKAPKELSIWVVGDETAGFSDIITGFKNRYPTYKNTDIKVTKFGNYADYQETLLAVIGDGNSPDIFVVNGSDGWLLESKILAIPASIIDPDDFSKNFHKVFDGLIIENKEADDSGKEQTVSGIKGVPLGYQAMGVFYNWKLLKTIPSLWSEIGQKTNAGNDEENSTFDDPEDYTDLLLGLDGKYIPGSSDILSLFFVQNGVHSYEKLSEAGANKALESYLSFSEKTPSATLAHIESTMKELNLTTVDMFVRGKIGMVVGFPSLLREIEYSIKRAGSESVLSSLNLRTTKIPQSSLDPKDAINLGEYYYFALSKLSPNMDAGYSFLSYLATGEAGEKYLGNFPSYLPAQRLHEESKANEPLSDAYSRVKYGSFMDSDRVVQAFQKGLKNKYDAYFSEAFSNKGESSKNILLNASKYIECNKKHLIDQTAYEEECRMR